MSDCPAGCFVYCNEFTLAHIAANRMDSDII